MEYIIYLKKCNITYKKIKIKKNKKIKIKKIELILFITK